MTAALNSKSKCDSTLRGTCHETASARRVDSLTAASTPRRLSCDHDDGVAAALSREDAIDATAVSPTRRDGPDVVRNSLKSTKKPPTAS